MDAIIYLCSEMVLAKLSREKSLSEGQRMGTTLDKRKAPKGQIYDCDLMTQITRHKFEAPDRR